jgi:hypothetical protein
VRATSAVGWVRAAAGRHDARVWLLWLLGASVLLLTVRYAAADPAILALLLDPELLAVMTLAALALVRGDVRAGLARAGAAAIHLRAAVAAGLPAPGRRRRPRSPR